MLAVGILAYQLGGRVLWLLPSVFGVVMGIGGILGAADIQLPYVETGIAVSIIVLGTAILLGIKGPVVISAGLAGLFALFHGYAYGAEMPEAGSAVASVSAASRAKRCARRQLVFATMSLWRFSSSATRRSLCCWRSSDRAARLALCLSRIC